MLKKLIILSLIFHVNITSATDKIIEIDYVKANINLKNHPQVPKGVLIWTKQAAYEPVWFAQGPMKGHGWREPLDNHIIKNLRKHFEVDVNYFTTAKMESYHYPLVAGQYEVCSGTTVNWKTYEEFFKTPQNTKNYYYFSIPLRVIIPIDKFAIRTEKIPAIKKHLYPNSSVYNLKALLDDEKLKTIQVINFASGIYQYVYSSIKFMVGEKILLPKYKYRVYEFVSSNAEQIPLMLRGKRMDWADVKYQNDFYFNLFKIGPEVVQIFDYSPVHPDKITKDDLILSVVRCNNPDKNKLAKIMNIINTSIKETRTNYAFLQKIMQQYSKDFPHMPYVDPKEFYLLKYMMQEKMAIDRGDFDLYF